MIDADDARRIASADAATAYRDLSGYDVRTELRDDGWHVDFVLTDPELLGGGPSYVLDGETGEVLLRRYAQ